MVKPFNADIRELKQRQRWRQRERQKTNKFKVMLHETIRNDDF